VGQVLGQIQPSAGATSLQGSVTGGVSNADPKPIRWIEFMDMKNDWSKLGNTFTVEAWIWHSNSALSSWQPVLSRHPGGGSMRQNAHFIIAVRDNSNLEVTAGCGCDSNGNNCGNGFSMLATGQSFATQTWQHVAVTFNGDGTTPNATATLYIQGQKIASSVWGASDAVCAARAGQWARYADVSVGFVDDQNTNPFGWTGRIDEIRFWDEVRSGADILAYFNVGLEGDETDLFAYYQFDPSEAELQNLTAPKQITNKVADMLHGLPQPDPTDVNVFVQSSSLVINTYSVVEGQSDADSDLPPLPNQVHFESYPETNLFSVVSGYSPQLQSLLTSGVAEIFGNPSDLSSVTVFVTCPANNCSAYTAHWKDYYFSYTATFNGLPTAPARDYLRIVTACPSGVFDSCGVCEGDNSQCQCVVYHGFETERMSHVLLEWSLENLIAEVENSQTILTDTLLALDSATPSDPVLRQQIYDLMNFYNDDLTNYCGDLWSFMTQLESATPQPPEAIIDASATSDPNGAVPWIPGFFPPPSSV